jgi:hypothetical protein
MGIKDQHDAKLMKQPTRSTRKSSTAATQGNLRRLCGKTVREIKDILIADFKKAGVADRSMIWLNPHLPLHDTVPCEDSL